MPDQLRKGKKLGQAGISMVFQNCFVRVYLNAFKTFNVFRVFKVVEIFKVFKAPGSFEDYP